MQQAGNYCEDAYQEFARIIRQESSWAYLPSITNRLYPTMNVSRITLNTLESLPPWEWPDGANETVADALRDRNRDAEDRLTAAAFAGDSVLIDDELALLLLEVIKDSTESEELRSRAAISLGPVLQMTDEEWFDEEEEGKPITDATFATLTESLKTIYASPDVPKNVRRYALEASIRAPRDWHRNAVRAAYYDGDPAWKLTAVFAMGWIRGFDDEVLEALESTDLLIRMNAVSAAGSYQLDEAWPHIEEILTADDPNKQLLLAAIEAAPNIRPKASAALLAAWIDSDDEDVAEAVDEAMMVARFESESGIP